MIGKKTKINILYISLIIITFLSGSVFSNNTQFTLNIDRINIEQGTSVNLDITIEDAPNAEVIEILGLENFNVVSINKPTSYIITNGNYTHKKSNNYVIIPKDIGEFTLQGIVEYQGKRHNTNIIKVNVTKANVNVDSEERDLFINTNISNNDVYLGQKLVLEYDFYTRYNIQEYGFVDKLDLSDFISKDISQNQLSNNIININGTKYAKYEVTKKILSPIKVGNFNIPSYSFQANISTRGFFSASTPEYIQTQSKDIVVKYLPTEHKPSDFTGIVGELHLESNFSRTNVEYGDSLTLNVIASGDCNLDNFKKVIKGDIKGVAIYETEKNKEESIKNNKYYAKKEFEIILVPDKTGDIIIEPIVINYFNPYTGKYEESKISGTTIHVTGEMQKSKVDLDNNSVDTNIIKIQKVSYDIPNGDYLNLKINKKIFLISIIIAIVIAVAIIGLLILKPRMKKYDENLQEIYIKLKKVNNEMELYNILNDIIKYNYGVSLKANSKTEVAKKINNTQILECVMEIVNYIENKNYKGDKSTIDIKSKIYQIKSMISLKSN